MGPTNPFTALVPRLAGKDPDDAFSVWQHDVSVYFLAITFSLQVVPYEKGSTFLWYLEDLVGGAEVFEPFLKSYYNNFAYKSIDSDQFKAFFLEKFSTLEAVKQIDWDTWLHTPGMPIYKVQYDSHGGPPCHLKIF